MSFLKSDLYKDYGASGDLSDVSEVDADELAAILGEVDGGGGKTGDEDKKKVQDKKTEVNDRGRGDWLGLSDTTTPITQSISRHTTISPLSPSKNKGESGVLRSKLSDGPSRKDNKQDLMKELFGDSKWASGSKESQKKLEDKDNLLETKVKSESFLSGSSLNTGGRGLTGSSESYIPSSTAPRRPRRQPPKPLDIDDFGFSNLLTEKKEESSSNSLLGVSKSDDVKDSIDLLLKGAQKSAVKSPQLSKDNVLLTTTKAQESRDAALLTGSTSGQISNEINEGTINTLMQNKIQPSYEVGASVPYVQTGQNPQIQQMQPVNDHNVLSNVAHNVIAVTDQTASNTATVHPQFYPLPPPVTHLSTGDEEMVEELKNAQATFGAALAAHHTNIKSYMQLLLDEARRLTVVSKVSPKKSDSKTQTGNDDELSSIREDAKETRTRIDSNSETETHDPTEKSNEEVQTDYEPIQHNSLQKMESIEPKRRNNQLHNEAMQEIKELKTVLQRLEIENSNLILKLENMKSHHEMEIEFLKKMNGQEALLWETRIEKIQQFCFSIEKEFDEKINKMKENEEELIRNHKARIQTLQNERLSDLQQLSDLHKAIMEQTLSTATVYPHYKDSTSRIIRSPEKPANMEELTEREATLLKKERQLEESRMEWEDEKRRGIESAIERERSVREAERSWESRRDAETRELARREARTEELSRLVDEMRQEALNEAKQLAADKLRIQTDRARLEALMKAETGIIANPEHILQMRAEVEAGMEEMREVRGTLENERKRINEEWSRLESRVLEVETRERELARVREEAVRDREDTARERNEYERLKAEADRAEAKAKIREQEAAEKTLYLEQQIREIAKERLEVKRDKLEIETAKTRLDLLLPELGPNELFTVNPPRNYVDPKAVILRLRAEKELESYVINPTISNKPFS